MPLHTDSHLIDAAEISKITQLGYRWQYAAVITLEYFLRQSFPGLHLFDFLRQIDNTFGSINCNAPQKHIELADHPPRVSIWYYSEDYQDPVRGLLFARTFINDQKVIYVNHDYLVLPERSRGLGIGKKILACCLDCYEKLGVDKICVHAALQDGGYVWARVGFKAIHRHEVKVILDKAKVKLDSNEYALVKSWYDYHYNNFPGDPFDIENWARLDIMIDILRGSSWHGEIDLKNPEELSNFKKYVSR